jgi:MFS family permease
VLQSTNLLSALANSMVLLLIPWLVLSERGSPAQAGLVIAIAATPAAVITILSGALTDRIGARRVSVLSDFLSMISVLLFPLALLTDRLGLAALIALATLGAMFDPAGFTARKTVIPNVATRVQMSVPQVNSIHEAVFGASWVLGPAVTGLLIARFGVVVPFFVAAVMFLLSAAAMLFLPVTSTLMSKAQREAGLLTDLRDGVSALWRNRVLRVITVSIVVLAGVYLPVEGVLLPTLYQDRAQPEVFGLVLTALGAGSIVGALAFAPMFKRIPARAIFSICLAGSGLIILAMATLPSPVGFIALGALLGVAWGPMQPLLNTLIQTSIEPQMQGRVFGIQVALFSLAPPLGYLVAGVATQALGVAEVFLAIALTLLLVGLLAIWRVYRR